MFRRRVVMRLANPQSITLLFFVTCTDVPQNVIHRSLRILGMWEWQAEQTGLIACLSVLDMYAQTNHHPHEKYHILKAKPSFKGILGTSTCNDTFLFILSGCNTGDGGLVPLWSTCQFYLFIYYVNTLSIGQSFQPSSESHAQHTWTFRLFCLQHFAYIWLTNNIFLHQRSNLRWRLIEKANKEISTEPFTTKWHEHVSWAKKQLLPSSLECSR